MKTLSELAELVGGELVGDPAIEIYAVADLESAGTGDISFLTRQQDGHLLAATSASAVVVPASGQYEDIPVIAVKDPYLAIAIIHNTFLERPFLATGVHEKAVVGVDCRIAAQVSIGPLVVIGDRVSIAERAKIHPGVVIGDDVVIGKDVELRANVTLYDGCRLGKRVTVHSGTVIGCDGFGYATDTSGHHVKRPHVGTVQIDDDVEIGSNVSVDRATFGKTWIKRGTKIDNLVQIAHNVVVGENSFLVSQSGIAGSSTVGNGVILGGQVGLSGHINLGDRVMVGSKSGVHNDVPSNTVVSGYPAIAHRTWLRSCSVLPKLPDLVKEVRRLKKELQELKKAGSDE